MLKLNAENFRQAISVVNKSGFAAIDLSEDLPKELGSALYKKMDEVTLHPAREHYYNELAFYWPEEWADVPEGIGSFHEQKSLKHIYPVVDAQKLLLQHFGESTMNAILAFAEKIKFLTVANHHGLPNNELRLARVMMRQMNETNITTHSGSDWHEDCGYDDRPYRQLLSVVVTTHGIPTAAKKHTSKVGELLIFNARDRREMLGLNEELAFIHTGPISGPKMFFFFEFLGPR